jgi:hypothetical protein
VSDNKYNDQHNDTTPPVDVTDRSSGLDPVKASLNPAGSSQGGPAPRIPNDND